MYAEIVIKTQFITFIQHVKVIIHDLQFRMSQHNPGGIQIEPDGKIEIRVLNSLCSATLNGMLHVKKNLEICSSGTLTVLEFVLTESRQLKLENYIC